MYKENANDSWTNAGSAVCTGINFSGYEHKGVSLGSPDFKIYIKGSFYYKVEIVGTPIKRIILSYVHDTSGGGAYSYSVGYGALSISVTPSSDNVGFLNKMYELRY